MVGPEAGGVARPYPTLHPAAAPELEWLACYASAKVTYMKRLAKLDALDARLLFLDDDENILIILLHIVTLAGKTFAVTFHVELLRLGRLDLIIVTRQLLL